jgi:hypothetical protein
MGDVAVSADAHRTARNGGWSLIVAAVGFVVVFSWLAANFGYPEVLDGAAETVLPALRAMGRTGRAVWTVYALLPLLLIPAAAGAAAAWQHAAPRAARIATLSARTAAVSMLLGLARWPTVHWSLASAWPTASVESREGMAALFGTLNLLLGNVIGEFVGEVALSTFFLATAAAMHASDAHRGLSRVGYAVGGLGVVAAFRNVSAVVQPFSDANSVVLPLWLLALGVLLVRTPVAATVPGSTPSNRQ